MLPWYKDIFKIFNMDFSKEIVKKSVYTKILEIFW